MWSRAGLLISLLEIGKNVVLWEGGVQKLKQWLVPPPHVLWMLLFLS